MVRSYDEEMQYLDKVTETCWKIKKGFVPNMNVCSQFYRLPVSANRLPKTRRHKRLSSSSLSSFISRIHIDIKKIKAYNLALWIKWPTWGHATYV